MKKDIKNLKIAVLMGGLSSEREISLKTGMAIYNELKKHNHNVEIIDINKRDLKWLINKKFDLVINGLHGTYGEDGVIQGLLDFLNIPYTGSGLLTSAIAMNKIRTKEILSFYNIVTPEWKVIKNKNEIETLKINYPLVFKPEAEGSAIGVYIVKNKEEAKMAFTKVKKISARILVEKYIKGTEISVPILDEKILPIIEIVPANEFYDYDAKYSVGKSTHIIPARIDKSVYKKAGEIALKIYNILDCRDLARIDMIVAKNKVYFLEVNTLPGMTSVSLFPESAKKAGISFYELILQLIKMAYKRWQK